MLTRIPFWVQNCQIYKLTARLLISMSFVSTTESSYASHTLSFNFCWQILYFKNWHKIFYSFYIAHFYAFSSLHATISKYLQNY